MCILDKVAMSFCAMAMVMTWLDASEESGNAFDDDKDDDVDDVDDDARTARPPRALSSLYMDEN